MKNKTLLVITHKYLPKTVPVTHRIKGLINNLADYSWNCYVLTMHNVLNRENTFKKNSDRIKVESILSIDTKKHLSFRGKHLGIFTYPDSYILYAIPALLKGYNVVKNEIDIIFTTFPVATSHLIGFFLSKLCNKPWIADYRDPMTQDDYPFDSTQRMIWKYLDRKFVTNARYLIFTTESSKNHYISVYPFIRKDKCCVIPNGYSEEDN
jgi:hypothetical protein